MSGRAFGSGFRVYESCTKASTCPEFDPRYSLELCVRTGRFCTKLAHGGLSVNMHSYIHTAYVLNYTHEHI